MGADVSAIEVDSSSIERSQPPRDWTLRSPILSRRVERTARGRLALLNSSRTPAA